MPKSARPRTRSAADDFCCRSSSFCFSLCFLVVLVGICLLSGVSRRALCSPPPALLPLLLPPENIWYLLASGRRCWWCPPHGGASPFPQTRGKKTTFVEMQRCGERRKKKLFFYSLRSSHSGEGDLKVFLLEVESHSVKLPKADLE
ncbi:hypothetical protein BRADI_3g54125v3 [Brachypodium distachyon]|uniref:Transmembrane protein n=1 Tax=Brachypodium distachyon TaxID=15368 RepID=A0A2K2D4Z1_BRADI|nr:hypothetical protein BRADI_3g54125v3 [Brachypodium distachyon]